MKSSWIGILTRLFGAVSMGLLVPKNINMDALSAKLPFNPFGLVFLTAQVTYILAIYFILALIADVLKHKAMKVWLRRFSGFCFGMAMAIGLGYYGLVHHSDAIQKMIAKYPGMDFLMFWMHGIPIILALMDMYSLASEGHSFDFFNDAKLAVLFGVWYALWSQYCYAQNGVHPYPFQNHLNWWQRVIFDMGFIVGICSMLYAAGVVSMRLRDGLVKKADTKKKAK
eukprot:Colp12_sorted_trinity150504_noHs@21006